MLCLIRTKACTRCGGDLSLEQDRYGTYMECIQCGATWNEPDVIKPNIQAANNHPVVERTKASVISK